MAAFISESKDLVRVVFWGAAAFVAGQALARRPVLRRVLSLAPFTAGAVAAYVIGCFVGLALLTYIP